MNKIKLCLGTFHVAAIRTLGGNCAWLSLVFLAVASAVSCTTKKSLSNFGDECRTETIDVQKDGFISQLDTNEYRISVEATLTLPESSALLSPKRLKYDEGHFYIQTEGRNQTIWVFDSTGNYVSRLGERGRKRNEYQTDITDWFHVSESNDVVVYEKNARKVHVFSLDGSKSEAFILKSWPNAVGVLDEGKLFCSFSQKEAKEGLQLALLSEDEGLLSRYIFLGEDMEFVPSDQSFYKVGDRLYHVPNLADSAIVFHADTVEKVVQLRFADGFLPDDIREEAFADRLEAYHAFAGVKCVDGYYETSRYRVVCFVYGDYCMNQLIDKTTGQQYRFLSALPKGLFPSTVFCVRGDKLYYLFTKEDVEELRILLNADVYAESLRQSSSVIQDICNGKVPLPAIVSLTIK